MPPLKFLEEAARKISTKPEAAKTIFVQGLCYTTVLQEAMRMVLSNELLKYRNVIGTNHALINSSVTTYNVMPKSAAKLPGLSGINYPAQPEKIDTRQYDDLDGI